jgi:hypothetical protein
MPLRIVNAGSTPGNSIESVLFGHEKGAFPGAFDRQVGAIQHCDGATLVIDEIDRLPMAVQERLAEAMARGDCRPIGARHSFRVDVRLIAASNFPLKDLVAHGDFLPELHAAIGTTTLALPPCANARSIFPRWPAISWPASANSPGCVRWALPMARWPCWAPMTGPATSASCRRSSSAPPSSAMATR